MINKNLNKKIIVIILIILSILFLTNFVFSYTGNGTIGNPYIFYNCSDLDTIEDGYMELANDINCNGYVGFTPNNYNDLTGTQDFLNGKGFSIIELSTTGTYNQAFLSNCRNCHVYNIKFIGSNHYATQQYSAVISAQGLSAVVRNVSIHNVTIRGGHISFPRIGGFFGFMTTGDVKDSYILNSKIYNVGTGNNTMGGVWFEGGNIERVFSNSIINEGVDLKSALVSFNYALNSNCTDSYYDVNTTGQTTNTCGINKTTSQLQNYSTYTNWDFNNTWGISNVTNYPCLLWESDCENILEVDENVTTNETFIKPITFPINISFIYNIIDITSKSFTINWSTNATNIEIYKNNEFLNDTIFNEYFFKNLNKGTVYTIKLIPKYNNESNLEYIFDVKTLDDDYEKLGLYNELKLSFLIYIILIVITISKNFKSMGINILLGFSGLFLSFTIWKSFNNPVIALIFFIINVMILVLFENSREEK